MFKTDALSGSKPEQYRQLAEQARAMVHGERDRIANAAAAHASRPDFDSVIATASRLWASRAAATTLANQLNFGSLPLTFEVQSQEQISATLGTEQLERGMLAGAIGLVLVLGYSFLQYRGLGIVTVASLVVAGALTYGLILLLSWWQGYRLSLPGVTGLIIAIGVTADSFIVYFERVRDEILTTIRSAS